MPVAVCYATDEHAGNHQRPVEPHRSHSVIEHALVRPLGKGLFLGLREAKINLCAEHLRHTGVAVGGEQLLRAQQAKRVLEVAGHGVLPAFAAIQREDRRTRPQAAGVERQHPAVFIVRMGNDEHQRRTRAQLAQKLL